MPLSSARLSRDNDLQNAAENRAPLKRGARGDAVKILQRSLIDLGFAMPRSTTNGTPDGIYGPESEATVKAHMSRILTKLNMTNRVQVAIMMRDAGLV